MHCLKNQIIYRVVIFAFVSAIAHFWLFHYIVKPIRYYPAATLDGQDCYHH